MSWKIDDILFQSYGVYVQSSKGVLDLPKLNVPFHDWEDENGVEYIPGTVLPATRREREIRLTCLMTAGNRADFESKVYAFWSVLKAEGLRVISCDYLSEPVEVYVRKEISIRALTAYNESSQVGKFNLYLTVPGDTNYNLISFK